MCACHGKMKTSREPITEPDSRIEIDYPGIGNNSQLLYDGLWRNTKIVETNSGSVTSTKQFVCCHSKSRAYDRCEERDASAAVIKQFFGDGQLNSSTKYFYSKDRLSSLREMTDISGVIQSEYSFDPYGRRQAIAEAVVADFGYAAYFSHVRSALNLTGYRDYSANLGRWINQDPIEERGGLNLFSYVGNNPLSCTDPMGLFLTSTITGSCPVINPDPPCKPGDRRRKCFCTEWCNLYKYKYFIYCYIVCMLNPASGASPPSPGGSGSGAGGAAGGSSGGASGGAGGSAGQSTGNLGGGESGGANQPDISEIRLRQEWENWQNRPHDWVPSWGSGF